MGKATGRSRLRRIAVGLAISFATLAVVLGVAEFVLRRCGYADNPAIYFDPQVGLRYYPNQQRKMLQGERVLGEFRTNEWGFRTPSFELARDPARTRIVCLGDSFTLGWGVGNAEAWPQQLQALCDASEGPGRVEVINLGQPDFNTVNEERLYRTFAHQLGADVVILGYVFNDLSPETLAPVDLTARIDKAIGTTAIMRFLRVRFFHNWGVYQPTNNPENRRRRQELQQNMEQVLTQPDGELGRSYWDVSMGALRELGAQVRADGAQLLVLSFPISPQVNNLHASVDAAGKLDPVAAQAVSLPQQRIARECREQGLPFLDLLEDFSRAGPSVYGDLDDSHPAAEGQRIAARAVHAWLERLEFLGPKAGSRAGKGHPIPDRGRDDR